MKLTITNCFYMYKKIWKFSKKRIILLFVLALFDAINIFISTFYFKFAIDGIMSGRQFSYLVILTSIRLGFLLIYQVLNNFLYNVIFPQQENKIKKGITLELYSKITAISMEKFDDSETYDMLARAINESDNRAVWMLGTLNSLLSSSAQIIVMFATLAYLSPWAIVIAIVGTLVTFWGNIINSKKCYDYEMRKTKVNRKLDYIKRVFNLPQYKEDLRMTNIDNILEYKYNENINELNRVVKKHSPSIAGVAIGASWLFNFLNIGVSSLYVGMKIYAGTMSIGDFASVIAAISTLSNNFLNFSNIIPDFKKHSMFIENYLKVIHIPIKRNKSLKPISEEQLKTITLKNVSFSYLHSDKVLNNINLTINKGQKIAIVGENGAGKTTLLRIIMGLYSPVEGCISFNDLNYKYIETDDIYKKFAAVQQDFQVYALTLEENISMNLHNETDNKKVLDLIELVKLASCVNKLENGINTNMTTEFENDGINLSGGQNQKLAIARALYAESDCLIMDEPSSALDPKSEQELFDIIDQVGKDKTVIMVSHRLSCVKNMDLIYYMENGQILEQGTHKDLLHLGGKYAELFRIQANKYSE